MNETISNVKIDQLRFFVPLKDDSVDGLERIPVEVLVIDKFLGLSEVFQQSSRTSGHNGYTDSFNLGSDRPDSMVSIMWNLNRKDMGISVNFSARGKATFETLSGLYGQKIDWKNIITSVYEKFGGHLSRIDIAVDLINYGFSVNAISKRLLTGESAFLNKLVKTISDDRYQTITKGRKTQTIYVGSRKSDAFLRVYNKKAEQMRPNSLYRGIAQSSDDWVRIEGEYKHRLAKIIGVAIADCDKDNIYPFLVSCILERWSLVDRKVKNAHARK